MDTEKLLSENTLCYGSDISLPAQIPLQAGPLQMIYESGSLRYIKSGETELVRMIYVALRDKRWGTYIPHITDEKLTIQSDSFQITYTCTYYVNKLPLFIWHALISGDASGNIYFEMKGKAETDFEKNRLGICVLHPIEPLKGKKVIITHPDHTQTTGHFPVLISPHQPFKNIRQLEYFPEETSSVSIQFAGDIFEMEDQRNWTDASYKTYSTPLEIPFPATVKKEDTVFQSVTVQVTGFESANKLDTFCTIFPKGEQTTMFPAIGIRQSSEYDRLNPRQITLLKSCAFTHYRIDIQLNEQDWRRKLQNSFDEASQLNTAIELALHLNNAHDLQVVLGTLTSDVSLIKSVILYYPQALSDQKKREEFIQRCKQHVPNAEVGVGTTGYFADVNRNRPIEGSHDFIVFSVNPQVHAFDTSTIIENLEAQKYPIETINNFVPGKKIHISPLEFRMSFAPENYSKDILPFQYDTRQMSLFAAGCTLGSLKYLAESGAASITYFETVGKKGIMAGEKADASFPAFPDMIYPVYYIFRELAEDKEAMVITCTSNKPLQLSSLLLKKNNKLQLLLANHTKEELTVDLSLFKEKWMVKQLNATTIQQALLFIEAYDQLTASPAENHITLAPFACCILNTR